MLTSVIAAAPYSIYKAISRYANDMHYLIINGRKNNM